MAYDHTGYSQDSQGRWMRDPPGSSTWREGSTLVDGKWVDKAGGGGRSFGDMKAQYKGQDPKTAKNQQEWEAMMGGGQSAAGYHQAMGANSTNADMIEQYAFQKKFDEAKSLDPNARWTGAQAFGELPGQTASLTGLKTAANPTGGMAAPPPTQVPMTAPPNGKLQGGDPSRVAGPQTTATTQQQPLATSPLAAPVLTAGAGPAAQQPITAATPLPSAPAPTALRAPAATSKYRSKASLGGLKRAARR